jgi:hypothetical protein
LTSKIELLREVIINQILNKGYNKLQYEWFGVVQCWRIIKYHLNQVDKVIENIKAMEKRSQSFSGLRRIFLWRPAMYIKNLRADAIKRSIQVFNKKSDRWNMRNRWWWHPKELLI